jgi:hypothetical protein
LEVRTSVAYPAWRILSARVTACFGRVSVTDRVAPRTLLWREVIKEGTEVFVDEELL